jgi:hypothetical protein
MGRLAEGWTHEWLPEVQEHLAHWEGCDLGGAPSPALLAHLDKTMACADRLWELHFLLASPMPGASSQFGKLYRELFGGGALDAYRLLEGFDNKIVQSFTIEVAGHPPGPNQRLHPLPR